MSPTRKAHAYLILVTAIWGATFPFIRNAVAHVDPFLFVGIRFLLGALLLAPLLWTSLKIRSSKLLIGTIVLGLLNGIAYVAQTIGLQTVPSSRAAFITGLSVVLVPLFTPFFKLGKPNTVDLICSLICLAGLYILTGANFNAVTHGDWWVLLGAVFFACSISYLQSLSLHINNHKAIAFYQVLFTVPLPLLFTFHANYSALFYPSTIIGILFCALAATSLAFFLQAKYQPLTTAPKAALIYSLEPVFASVFGLLINGEPITRAVVFGGILILLSLMLPALLQLWRR
jgi:drug/metabolite transporter (DMT)-like permease